MLGAAFLRLVPRIIDLLCMKESRTLREGSIEIEHFFQTVTMKKKVSKVRYTFRKFEHIFTTTKNFLFILFLPK